MFIYSTHILVLCELILNHYPRIGITTKSIKLSTQIQEILYVEGFKPRVYIDKRSNSRNIEVYGWKQLKMWTQLISSSNPKKLSLLNAPVAQTFNGKIIKRGNG